MLVDVTQDYGAAFYSCAAGLGVSAVCLLLLVLGKSTLCQTCIRVQDEGKKADNEENVFQDSDQLDFLEMDLTEDSVVPQAEDQKNMSVI